MSDSERLAIAMAGARAPQGRETNKLVIGYMGEMSRRAFRTHGAYDTDLATWVHSRFPQVADSFNFLLSIVSRRSVSHAQLEAGSSNGSDNISEKGCAACQGST